jgi:prevent-host-death family protein
MQYISASDARNNLSELIAKSMKEPIVIQQYGRDSAVIISKQDYDRVTGRSSFDEIDELCKQVSANAKKKGLTESKLKKLLEVDEF